MLEVHMARCEGTTKTGARCKRPAATGSAYCATHADRAGPSAGRRSAPLEAEAVGSDSEGGAGRRKHPLADAALIGIVAIGMLAVRRLIRWH